ncbi:hypothetical protein J6590_075476 [Homalodisca vitripennis]|nr:hypothetical protein J6590_075476 [Homalodisca vitripennis]
MEFKLRMQRYSSLLRATWCGGTPTLYSIKGFRFSQRENEKNVFSLLGTHYSSGVTTYAFVIAVPAQRP